MDIIGIKSEFIKDRIGLILESSNYTESSKADISRALGVRPQYLNAVLSGQRNVSDKFYKKFCEVFNITQNELSKIKDKEQVVIDTLPKSSICEKCTEKDKLILRLENEIDWLRSQIENKADSSKRNSA